MARKPQLRSPKTEIVAFKVEAELANFLNKLQNKSAFIRKAIIAQLGMACPLCEGSGTVPRGLHDHYAPVLAKNNTRKCDICGNRVTLPHNVVDLPDSERPRLEQFLNGGPLYCGDCYTDVPPCDDCGWHVSPDHIADHFRKSHRD
ncbi:MAG: hypothetical protein ACJ8F7_02685 [Gemmataceae bacterium]